MKVTNARTKKLTCWRRAASQLFGQDKTILDEGFAGDVIGLNDPGSFAIGDTLYVGSDARYTDHPDVFAGLAYLRLGTGKYKNSSRRVCRSSWARVPCR